MGLHIKQSSWLKTQAVLTLITLSALAVQPITGVLANFTARADANTAPTVPAVVSPKDGSYLRPSDLKKVEWGASTDDNTPQNKIDYQYRLYQENPELNPNAPIRYPKDPTKQKYIGVTYNSADKTPGGEYWWRVRACDEQAMCSAWTPAQHFVVDEKGPQITNFAIDNSTNGNYYNKTIVVSATVQDDYAINPDDVKFYITEPKDRNGSLTCDGNGTYIKEVNAVLNPDNSRWEGTLTTEDLNGTYCVSARAGDKAKNHGNIAGKQLVEIDTIAPGAPTVTPSSGVINGVQTIVATPADATDAQISDVTASAEHDNSPVDLSTAWSVNSDGSYRLDTTGLYRGTVVTIVATATDKAGNSTSTSVTYTVQNDAPLLTVTPDTDTSSYTHTLTGTISPISSLTGVTVRFDGGAARAATINKNKGTWAYDLDVTGLTKGQIYYYTVTATDGYGNSVTSKKYPVTVKAIDTAKSAHNDNTPLSVVFGRTNTSRVAGTTGLFTQDDEANGLPLSESKPTVKGESIVKPVSDTAALAPSAHGWQLFHLAWYWWLLLIAVLVGVFWWLAAIRRKSGQEA